MFFPLLPENFSTALMTMKKKKKKENNTRNKSFDDSRI